MVTLAAFLMFVAYLWGIETTDGKLKFFDGSEFVAYLWGIETG